MLRKTIVILSAFILLVTVVLIPAASIDETPEFYFELSSDGMDTIEVLPGDTITVALNLKRTDAGTPYPMYAMQDEIIYDGDALEYIPNSFTSKLPIDCTDIKIDSHNRGFYMDYLSLTGAKTWNAETMIGSFQLKAIGSNGVVTIASRNSKVAYPDGSQGYFCHSNSLRVIFSTDCTVRFQTRGGSEISDTIVQYGELLTAPKDPIRDGYHLSGWYQDIDLTIPWDFDTDKVEGNMTLYAKWEPGMVHEEKECNPLIIVTIIAVLLIVFFIYIWKKKKDKGTVSQAQTTYREDI